MTTELWLALLRDLPADLVYWPVSLSLLGLAAAMIAARLARGQHWGWQATLGVLVAGMLAVPWMAVLEGDDGYEYVEADDAEECVCSIGCSVPEASDPQPGWVEVG